MCTLLSPVLRKLAIGLICLVPLSSSAQETDDVDVEAVFFDALELKDNGQCSFAVGRFQLCIEVDPTLHQARLHMAECYQEMGEDALAIREARFYLEADFPEAEVDRAKAVIAACGGDPDMIAVGGGEPAGAPPEETTPSDPGPTVRTETRPDADISRAFPGGAPRRWSHVRIGTGLLVTHFANSAKLTALGPLVDLRFMPERHIEFGITARVAMGPYRERGGTVTVPQFAGAIALSIPLRGPRLTIGALIPMVLSGLGDQTRIDGGILGEVGIHIPAGESPVVIEALFEGGYLVSPVIGGRVGLAFQLGPRRLP